MHVALVCPDLTGHLNPMTTLGRELARRGHAVTVFGLPPAQRYAGRAGLRYVRIGGDDFDTAIAPSRARLAELTGLSALKLTGQLLCQIEEISLRELPAAFRAAGVDAVVTDQVSPAGASVAEALGRPYALACNALCLHQEPGVPPGILPWAYRRGVLARLRNRLGNGVLRWAARPMRRVIDEFRAAHRLPPLRGNVTDGGSELVQVAQQPAFFDFPREQLPDHFHYTGPWHEEHRDADVDFPWAKLDGRPLVYASLGTLQNRLAGVFRAIVEACSTLDAQLVLALGRAPSPPASGGEGRGEGGSRLQPPSPLTPPPLPPQSRGEREQSLDWLEPLPPNTIVVPFAPQLALLDRAAAVVTHAGLNTVLEALARSKPMVCLPVTNDQPGVARRVEWLGAGVVLKPAKATADRLRPLIRAVLEDPSYRSAAELCGRMMAAAPGFHGAADVIEKAFATGKRVARAA